MVCRRSACLISLRSATTKIQDRLAVCAACKFYKNLPFHLSVNASCSMRVRSICALVLIVGLGGGRVVCQFYRATEQHIKPASTPVTSTPPPPPPRCVIFSIFSYEAGVGNHVPSVHTRIACLHPVIVRNFQRISKVVTSVCISSHRVSRSNVRATCR